MLITFLNVGQGHSVILRVPGADNERFGVIDSRWQNAKRDALVCRLLNRSDAKTLEFVVLTHPHKDHYLGIGSVLEDYSRAGFEFKRFIEPSLSSFSVLENRLVAAAVAKAARSGNAAVTPKELYRVAKLPHKRRTSTGQLARIVKYGYELGKDKHVAPDLGETFDLTDKEGELICELLSPDKEEVRDAIIKKSSLVDEEVDLNAISLGLLLIWKEARVLVCGDVPDAPWEKVLKSSNVDRLRSDAIDVGHHGGAGNSEELWRSITLAPVGGRSTAVISAGFKNTYGHPQETTLKRILHHGSRLHCINRAKPCLRLDVSSEILSPIQQAMINRARQITRPKDEARRNSGQWERTCSGQITLAISPAAEVTIAHREREAVCAYERDVFGQHT